MTPAESVGLSPV